jgi:hypothetical protein
MRIPLSQKQIATWECSLVIFLALTLDMLLGFTQILLLLIETAEILVKKSAVYTKNKRAYITKTTSKTVLNYVVL